VRHGLHEAIMTNDNLCHLTVLHKKRWRCGELRIHYTTVLESVKPTTALTPETSAIGRLEGNVVFAETSRTGFPQTGRLAILRDT